MSTEHLDVLVVGAGLSGIGAGHYLQAECPWASYAIFEARDASLPSSTSEQCCSTDSERCRRERKGCAGRRATSTKIESARRHNN